MTEHQSLFCLLLPHHSDDMPLPTVVPELLCDGCSPLSYSRSVGISDALTALSICSVTNDTASKALSNIKKLRDSEAHATYILSGGDKKSLKELRINITCESEYLNI